MTDSPVARAICTDHHRVAPKVSIHVAKMPETFPCPRFCSPVGNQGHVRPANVCVPSYHYHLLLSRDASATDFVCVVCDLFISQRHQAITLNISVEQATSNVYARRCMWTRMVRVESAAPAGCAVRRGPEGGASSTHRGPQPPDARHRSAYSHALQVGLLRSATWLQSQGPPPRDWILA